MEPTPADRSVSLDRLASPEQLDQLMTITRPTGWLAMGALGAILAVAVVWGIYGRIPQRVGGRGIMIRAGGIFDAVALGSGQVQEIVVHPDQRITKGQVIARISQPELEQQLQEARENLARVEGEQGKLTDLDRHRQSIAGAVLTSDLSFLHEKLRQLTTQRQFLEQHVAGAGGNASTTGQLQEIEDEIANTQNAIGQNQLKQIDLGRQREQSDISREQLIARSQQAVRDLENALDRSSVIRSPLSGTVVDLRASLGQLVSPGSPILSIELDNAPLLAVIYIDADDGKKVQPGMPIQLSPSTVKKEIDGFMLGTVDTVSIFPASVEGMMTLLHNDALVKELSQQGPPIAVFVRPVADPKSPSGFRWSSGSGPSTRITAGTPCTGAVVVQELAPINLVIPALREKVGM